jgi:hypothetical protein
MEKNRKGWVIVNENHPNNPRSKNTLSETFAYTRKDSIAKFVSGSGSDWRYWYRKYNFRAVKAEMTIRT